jgi:hypothetical protein
MVESTRQEIALVFETKVSSMMAIAAARIAYQTAVRWLYGIGACERGDGSDAGPATSLPRRCTNHYTADPWAQIREYRLRGICPCGKLRSLCPRPPSSHSREGGAPLTQRV